MRDLAADLDVIRRDEGVIHQLPTFAGDPDGNANAINDHGQAVGPSGNCTAALHAVLWKDGKAIELGNLGGTSNNEPTDIDNEGQVVGFSDLSGDLTFERVPVAEGRDDRPGHASRRRRKFCLCH